MGFENYYFRVSFVNIRGIKHDTYFMGNAYKGEIFTEQRHAVAVSGRDQGIVRLGEITALFASADTLLVNLLELVQRTPDGYIIIEMTADTTDGVVVEAMSRVQLHHDSKKNFTKATSGFYALSRTTVKKMLEDVSGKDVVRHVKEQTEDGVNRFIPRDWLLWFDNIYGGEYLKTRAVAIQLSLEAVLLEEFGTDVCPPNHRISYLDSNSPEIVLERIYTERR